MATVYLLHFDRPYPDGKMPQHYLGVAADLEERLREHRTGSSKGRLTRALFHKGIGFSIAKVWNYKTPYGAFKFEKKLKKRKRHADFCPMCNFKGGSK